METTHKPPRAGHLAYVLSICLLGFSSLAFSQPTVTVRFANPFYDCAIDQYCVDVEFRSDQQDVQVFGMNVRFFYDDDELELVGFTDFQGGYGPFPPNPPEVFTNGPAGPALFNFTGPADFVNGAIQLLDTTNAIPLDTVIWTKLFQICFIVEDTNPDVENFCPPLVWDMEQDPANGGFAVGSDGVVITVVDPDPDIESGPSIENVVQFNWMYTGPGTPPYGEPVEIECTSINCNGRLSVLKTDTLLIGACLEPGDSILYNITVINEGIVTISNITISDPGTTGLECIPAIPFSLDPGDTVLCTAVHLLTQGDINAGTYSNVATATGTNPDTVLVSDASDDPADTTDIDPNADGNPDDPTVTLLPFPEITLEKTDILDLGANGTLAPGDQILYTITVTNTGNQLISNITLSDPNATGLSCTPFTPFSLAPGASASCSAFHVITQMDIETGFYENSATGTGENPDGDPVSDVSDDPSDTTDIDPNGDCNPDDPTVTLLVPTPVIIVRFSNPDFNCLNEEYCLDVEFMSDTDSLELFGMNVRFFYDDDILELIDFRDFQGGYGPVSPDPPTISTSAPAGPALFNFAGPAEFINGAIQLTDDTQTPIYISDTSWTKIFQICFTVDDLDANIDTFCPPVVWDLEVDPEDGGFLVGDDGVVITIVDPDSMQMSVPIVENVVQFNWQYSGPGTPPFGEPIELECTSINCFPVITCAVDTIIDCDVSTDPSVTGFATSSDNCEGDSTITFTDSLTTGSCPQSFTITRTWIVTNACDLSDTCIQLIMVIDTIAPVILCPPDTIIDCTASTSPDSTGIASATDNCDTLPEITFSDTIAPGTCPQEYTITRTWVATDSCGNSSSCIQLISIIDTLPPVIACPADITIECTASTSPDITGLATATDNCDTLPEITFSDVSVGGACPQEYTITRTWVATDTCGNSDSCIQIIQIIDTLPPVLSCPADTIIECTASTSPDSLGFATAIDNCDTVPEITFSDSIALGACPQEYTITRTWVATDTCGNSSSCVQIISIIDTLPPVITCPADTIIECTASTSPDSTGFATAIDNCDTLPAITFSDSIALGACPQEYTITRTWVATDTCGNSSSCIQIISIIDTLPPVITCPSDTIIDCTASPSPDSTGFATAIDNCDTLPAITFSDSIALGACPQEYTISRTWVATDTCGNSSSCIQIISIIDTLPPVITCPADTIIECTASTSPDSLGIASAIDNCDTLPEITFSDSIATGTCPQEMIITRTWVATDTCGNSSSCIQTISIVDTLPPVITCPSDITIECTVSPSPDITGFATATDNCDTLPEITFSDVSVGGACPQEYTITRTWVATDTCGNSSSCIQIIQVIDTLPPVIICPADTIIQCTASTSPDSLGIATATDNCDTLPAITFSDVSVAGSCPQEYTITRTWVATDTCGNSSSCVQIISIIDTLPPVITCPADTIIDCTASTSPDSTGFATAIDNCDTLPAITFSDSIALGACPQEYTISRTWVATDTCGNSSSCIQIISIIDTLPPVITCPADTIIECTASTSPDSLGIASAIDNCDTLPEITFSDSIATGTCPQEMIITRTWVATDTCGNSSSCIQTISIVDTLPPVITCPSDITLECTVSPSPDITGFATATDNCDTLPEITFSDVSVGGACPQEYTITRTWVATDTCGNSSSCIQIIQVIDTLPPVITCPADTIIQCTASTSPDSLGIATATDNCDTLPAITFSDVSVAGSCPQEYTITRTWVATDTCGNSSSCVQIISIIDTLPPVITCPADTIIECTASTSPDSLGTATAIDNCDTLPEITFSDSIATGTCPQEMVITRTWVATDTCGNSSSCIQIISIIDTLPPVITCPADTLIECTASTSPDSLGIATAIDNCDTLPEITFSDSIATGTCPQEMIITRTWVATDTCGNSSSCIQIISITDTLPPIITCPVDTIIECTASTSPDSLGIASATDNCDTLPEITFNDSIATGTCPQEMIITRTWVATDSCGNSSSCIQIISIIDTLPPFITCPTDLTIECTASTSPDSTGFATATDNCDTLPEIIFSDVSLAGQCPQEYMITRTWVATDTCGNSSSCVQIISIIDTLPPVITCPVDTFIECTASTLPDSLGFATAIDNCDTLPEITFSDSIAMGTCPQEMIITRTWVATDTCGNSSSCVQIISVADTLAPVITCPPDVVITSTESTSPDSTGIATATDNCDVSPAITSSDVTIEGPCPGAYTIERTWVATDSCGNSSTCQQIITVEIDCGVDLALEKTLNAGQDNLQPGDDVTFTIEVTNEGTVTIGEIHVVDYIPIGFTLNDPDWTAGTDGSTGQSASVILSVSNGFLPAGGLLTSQSVTVEITLQINVNIPPGIYENIAEISLVIDIDGNDVSDADSDSDPDTDDANDPDAEDDHDGAIVCLLEPPVIVGSLFVCPGDIVTYTVSDFDTNLTYVFTLVNGGGLVLDTTPSSITIAWDDQPGGPFEISLTVIGSPECQDSASIFVHIEGGEPIACIDHINISIDNECGTVILSGMILTGEGAGNNNFQVFIIDMNGDTIPNATLTFEHVGQSFMVSVRSRCTGQSCWGWITVEDKLPPIINCVCPLNNEGDTCQINCLQLDEFLNEEIPEEFRPTVVDNCGGTTLEVTNVEYSFPSCINGFLQVTWKATDTGGNVSTCIQEFDIVPFNLDSLVFPPDYEAECGGSADPSVTGWPQIDGMDLIAGAPICNILVSYWDRELPLCGGGRRILRTWNVMDWCAGEVQQFLQMIKLADHIGPVLTCPANMNVSTSTWFCYANVIVPKPLAVDQCSDIGIYSLASSAGIVVVNGNTFSIHELPVGTHVVTWTVRDECQNSSTCSFQITVVDNVPPTVSCHLHTVVSLSDERPNGITLVFAESFNDGSFDNCGPVTFRARRMDSCIDQNWTTGGACVDNTPGGNPPVDAFDLGTVLGPCVPFACCDIGQAGIMVELEVTDEAGNVNYCMVEVEVQDKLAPELVCPPQILLSCEFLLLDVQEGLYRDSDGNNDGTLDEDPLSEIFGNMYDAFRHNQSERQHIIINDPENPNLNQPFDWGIEGWATDNCQLNLSVMVSVIEDCSGAGFPGDHPAGAVKLIERRFIANDGVQSGSCLQRIWVIDFDPFFIEDTTCFNENPNDGVIWPCDVLLTNCPDDPMGTGVPIILEDGCSLIGLSFEDARYDFVDSVCYKILRTWKVLDWCQFNPNTGYGLWTYTQTIKVADAEGAEFLDAPSTPPDYCVDDPGISIPVNNQMFLGENHPDASSCSVHTNLSLQVHETCSSSIIYDVKIYLFNGPAFIQIVPETTVALDANHEAEIHFNTEESTIPSIQENGLPYNSSECGDYHRVLWSIEDGCGNRSFADYLFRLEDCKNPTPVCLNGISTMIMPPEGEVTILASNFNASSFDDCTPGDELLFSFSGDTYQPSFTYTCDNVPDFDVEIPVQIWAADAGVDQNCNGEIEWSERNKAFCITYIIITDDNNVCDEESGILEGEILTAFTDAVSHVVVNLTSPGNTFPPVITSQDGKFSFANVPMGSDYTIIPARGDNYRNGVSTLDLVGIQKHLLGLEVFTSPYQYIAADANNSQSISAIDLIEIRKLILGVQDEFTSNQSWRFVREGIPMAPGNPWPFEEDIEINHLDSAAGSGLDFVGVKIGDINNTVQANATQILPRSMKRTVTVKATYDGNIKPGEMVDVEFEFSEQVSGFQWTFETTGLEFAGITSNDIEISEQNIGVLENGIITMSWNGDAVEASKVNHGMKMTLRFKVTKEGRIIHMLHMGSKITAAEAYTSEGEIMNVNLTFNSSGVFTDFALFQNKPNPWNNQTVIGFHLPSDAAATLTIYDLNGKILKTISGDYKAGYNSVTLSVKDIQATGILYYRLDSGPYSANKKMVIIQ